MRAKIVFIAENNTYREELRQAQEAMSELAIAFSHSFIMREMTIDPQEPESTFEQMMQEHDAVLLAGSAPFARQVAQSSGAFAASMAINQSPAAADLSRVKDGQVPAARLVWPLLDEPVAIGKAAVAACALTPKSRGGILCIQDMGEDASLPEALEKAAMYAALPSPRRMSLDEALAALFYEGLQDALVFASSRNIAPVKHLLQYIGGSELVNHLVYHTDTGIIPAVQAPSAQQGLPLFSMLYAAAHAVRVSLGLVREGDCLHTAVDNVLASGVRTMDFGLGENTLSADEVLVRIAQQVRLAGELAERFGYTDS